MPSETASPAGTRDRLETVAVQVVLAARRSGKTDSTFRALEAILSSLAPSAPAALESPRARSSRAPDYEPRPEPAQL